MFFAKGHTPNRLEEVFGIKKVQNNVINGLNGEEIIATFYKKNCKGQIKQNLE